ncbi:MAG: YDG domain-containing protein [Comamonas sp.]|jgi:filamentous hemagglutinin family protein|nr:YDG domain-containing protein [Comamonas sp.]
MNHTYRLVWSDASQRYVPVPECARGHSKSKTAKALMPAALVLGAALGLPLSALAQAGTTIGANTLPTGGSVVQGSASIGQNGNAMTVQQGSGKVIINWGSFNIGKDASVQFQQHQNTDIALNRVTGSDGSQILGQLTANGQVWLVNPNGIVFGQGARVDVGGLVASTLNITDQDFRDGNYRFSRNLQGGGAVAGISNQGQITARDGGSIALLAPTVSNDGVLRAQLGTVAMAAGDRVTLSAGANGLLQVEVDPSTIGTLVENKQLIVADGGQVIMTGKAADALSASVVSNTGTVQARTLQQKEGRILLLADMAHGTARIGGTLDASAPGGINGGTNSSNGGFIETSGAQVQVADGVQVTTGAAQGRTGTWLIDPTDFSVHAGAGAQTVSGIGADTLAANLANNHITLQTDGAGSQAGDLTVDAAVTWGGNNTLTLKAHNDIKVNAAITNTGSGSFAANAGGSFRNAGEISLTGGDVSITSGTTPGTLGNTYFEGAVTARNLSVQATGDITQSIWGSGRVDLGVTGELRADAGGKVDLVNSANVFGVVSGNSDYGHFSVLSWGSPNASLTMNGITTQGGDIAVRNFAGSLSVNGAVSSGGGHIVLGANNRSDSNVTLNADVNAGAGSVVLFAARNIDQIAGMVTADSLQASSFSGGAIGLGQLNQVGRVGFHANRDGGTGSIVFRNGQGFAVGGLPLERWIAGIYFDRLPTGIAAGGDVTLSGVGRIDGDAAVNVGGVFSLEGGDWRQVGAALPSFQAKDFRIGSGASFLRVNGGDGSKANPYQIGDVYGLQGMGSSSQYLASAWTLMNDIDASATANWNLNSGVAQGFKPIGNSSAAFTGALNGQGFAIKDLKVNTASQDAGLFGRITGATISDVVLSNASVASQYDQGYAGALAGQAQGSTISGVSSNGSVTSYNMAGGLLGFLGGSRLQRSSSSSNVRASYQKADGGTSSQLVHMAGGLVGSMNDAIIDESWASGTVLANGLMAAQAGGLVGGGVINGTIFGSYSTSAVEGTGSNGVKASVGGLAGQVMGGLKIDNSYYQGPALQAMAANNSNSLGGLVGADERIFLFPNGVNIRNSYANVGTIVYGSAPTVLGGMVGKADSKTSVSGSFWNYFALPSATGNGLGTVDSVSGVKTAAQLRQLSTFTDAGWDIDDLGGTGKAWRIYEGNTTPLLRGFLKGSTVNVGVTGWPVDMVYNGQAATGSMGVSSYGWNGTLQGTLHGGLHYRTNGKNAGTYSSDDGSLLLSGGLYSDQQGYDISYRVVGGPATLTIQKRALTVGGITAVNKIYDGDTSATLAWGGGWVQGLVSGDQLSFNASGKFDDKNVGTGKTVSVTGTIGGADAGNYEVTFSDATANISKRAITGTITADGKTYDGNVQAVTHGRLNGVLNNDDLTVASTNGQFSDKNADIGKTVNVGGTVAGVDAGNYDVTFNSTTTADIARLAINGTISADGKTYDGSVQAVTHGRLKGVLNNDDLTVASTSGQFSDKNAGAGKAVAVVGTVTGADAGNYDVTFNSTTTADIAKLAINGVISADGKTYDGNRTAVTHGGLNGVLNNDDLRIASTSGSFADKNAAAGKAVAVVGTVTGADAGNYDVTFNSTTTADIAKLAITGAITADGKTYDGNRNAITHGRLNGVLNNDDLTVASTSGQFSDKNAGTGKTVNVGGMVAGADAGNYDVTFNTSTTADIAKLAITGTISADGKTYDGDRTAVTHGGLNGVLNNDDLRIASTIGQFSDKNAGIGKTVNVGGTVAGADAGNYDVTFNRTTQADIAKLAINGAITADGKTYDGNVRAVTHGRLNGVLSNDDLIVASTNGSFTDKNAGTGKTVNVGGTVAGADAGNYDVTFNSTTTADIAKLAINGTITADNKTYDTTTNASTHGQLNGVLQGDDMAVASTSGSFVDKNAGTGKTVAVSGAVSGADADNYDVTFNRTTQADIAKLAITGAITADGKTYDGNRNAMTHGRLNGVLNNDDLRITSTIGQFSDKNAGIGKTVNVDAAVAGADAGNYEVTFNSTTTADIAKLAINGTITADNKTYDTTINASTHGQLNGVLQGDDLAVASTSGSFADKNAGQGKTVSVAGTVTGIDAGNYDVTFNGTTTADIAKRAITGAITADGKTYDGNAQAITHGRLNGVLNNDDLIVASTNGSFADKNAGMGKTVNVGGTVAGADAGNYDITFNRTTQADIARLAINGVITADGKTYDGNVQAVTHGRLDGVLNNDDLTVASTSGQFSDKNAGMGKTVNVGGTVAGADAGNYDVTFNGTTKADIARLAINGTITADNKTYDATTNASTHGQLNGVLAGDDLKLAASGQFDDKNAGAGKTVVVLGTVTGADAGNYDVTFNGTAQAEIAKRAITGAIAADNKTYDATTNAGTHGQLNGVLAGDDLTVASTSGSFSDKNAGVGKSVKVAGVLAGTDAGNYDVTFNSAAQASIAKRAITGAITADNKAYDGTTVASVHGSLDGVLAGDDLRFGGVSGQFREADAGVGKPVNVSGIVTGADAGNYAVSINRTTTASITSALPAPTVHAGLSGQILWRETMSSLEHEDLRFEPSAQLQGSAGNAPNLTLAPGYIRLDE